MSRSSARNRHRQPAAVKARQSYGQPENGPQARRVTLTGDQLAGVLAAQAKQAARLAVPLPRPPQWPSDPFAPGTPLIPAPINQRRPADRPRRTAPVRAAHLDERQRQYRAVRPLAHPVRRRGHAAVPQVHRTQEEHLAARLRRHRRPESRRPRRLRSPAATRKTSRPALRDKYAGDIARITDWWSVPNRKEGQDWAAWTSLLMENRLVFDAAAVYPRYNYGGVLERFEIKSTGRRSSRCWMSTAAVLRHPRRRISRSCTASPVVSSRRPW